MDSKVSQGKIGEFKSVEKQAEKYRRMIINVKKLLLIDPVGQKSGFLLSKSSSPPLLTYVAAGCLFNFHFCSVSNYLGQGDRSSPQDS
jgi:hypothetical protein